MSSKWFQENGRLSEGGVQLLTGVEWELQKLAGTYDLEEMSVQQVNLLGSNLMQLIGEFISATIQNKNK